MMEVTVHAQMILSCVLRTGKAAAVARHSVELRGARSNVLRLGLDRISTYGLMDKLSAGRCARTISSC
ncbi:MAG: RQC domain-containing protein [Merdibacter sp.]